MAEFFGSRQVLYLYLIVFACILAVSMAEKSTQTQGQNDDNFDQNILQSSYTNDGRKISIYNNFLLPSSVYLLRSYLSFYRHWEHTLKDSNNGSQFNQDSPDHILWKTFLNPQFFQQTRVGQKIRRAVKHFKGQHDGDDYQIYQATAKLVRRSQVPKSSIDAEASEGDVSAILYLIGNWKKNDYGDIIFYDNDQEIVCAVHPVMFRMVMFDSSIEHVYKPPSIDNGIAIKTIQVKLTKSVSKVNDAIAQWKTRSKDRIRSRRATLDLLIPSVSKVIDVEKHITRRFVGPNGRKIFVLDNLFSHDDLEKLRQIVNYKSYFFTDRFDDGSDGVAWVASFSIQGFIKSHLWDIHRQVVNHVGSRQSYFPYDVSCNLVQNNDNTRLHDDCIQIADQWTMVTYLNPNWTAQSGGETAFFIKKGHDNNDYFAEVRPRYGRSVIFQGMIYHSARPPTNSFDGIRYSFAVKMAEDEAQARVNRISEDFAIYAGNIDQCDFAIKIGRRAGRPKIEKAALTLLTPSTAGEDQEGGQQAEEEQDDENIQMMAGNDGSGPDEQDNGKILYFKLYLLALN